MIFALIIFILYFALSITFKIIEFVSRPKDLKKAKINGEKLLKLKNKTVIAVVGHPDDVDWYCGGTLSLLSKNNKVIVVVGTSGEKGGNGIPGLARVREQEQLRAANILGYDEVIFLRHPDRGLNPGKKLNKELEEVFKKFMPDVLFTFDTKHEGYIYRHSDHEAAGIASLNVAKDFDNIKDAYLFWSSKSNTIVEVSGATPLKIKALEAHESQRNARIRKIMRYFPIRRPTSGSTQKYAEIGIKNGEVFRKVEIDHDSK